MDIDYPPIPDEYSLFKRLSRDSKLEASELYQYEFARLASFSTYPEKQDINSISAANSGLYYVEAEKKIKCFCCQLSLPASIDYPVEVHRIQSPACFLLCGTDTSNKPLTFELEEDEDDSIEEYHSEFDLDESPSSISPTTSLPSVHRDQGLASGGASLPQINQTDSPTGQSENRPWNSLPSDRENTGSGVQAHPLRHSGSKSDNRQPAVTDSGRGVRTRLEDSSSEMFREDKRLETFRSWPSSANVSPQDLARLGFFYVGEEDKTQCAFCNGILRKWDKGDNIAAEHRKYFEHCLFVQGKETRNVPIPPPQLPAAPPSPGEVSSYFRVAFE